MSLLNLNSFHKQAIKATGQIQRRFQQTKTKPKLRQSYDVVPVFRKASEFSEKIALRDHIAQYTYGNIFMEAKNFSYQIGNELTKKYGERVMFLCPNDANYLITQWAIWMSGQVAVPLSCTHPHSALLYYANDCNSKLLISSPEYADLAHRVAKNTGTKLLVLDEKLKQNAIEKVPQNKSDLEAGLSADFYNRGNAMILYTSGTTGNPKGVVLTHKNLVTQCCALLDAWKWNTNDVILHTLPLHHVHGIINALYCPLYIGAKCVMLPKFDSTTVWSYLLGVNAPAGDRKITVFMAVPTIYSKLIEEYDKVFSGDSKMCEYIKTTLKNKIRLMVSGSAPLPVPVYNRWLDVSGHKLLERYGMTEIGMCLSQVYDSEREPGYVGVPLPGVSVQIGIKPEEFEGDYDILLECSSENGQIQFKMFGDREDGDPTGELLVKGDSVFKEYYNRPDATENEFTLDRYFKTGDTCQYSIDKKLFKILGRTNVDIIKTGGYKVSALEIETHLLAHPDILDCAVLGVKDEKWGEKVAAVVVLKEGKSLDLDALREFAKQKVAPYAAPTVMKLVKELPKNSMGKINKKELVKKAFGED